MRGASRSYAALDSVQYAASSNPAGRTARSSSTTAPTTRDTRYVRICSSTVATTYQTPPLSTRPSGPMTRTTVRVAALVLDAHQATLPDRLGEDREVRDRLARLEPAGRVEVEPLDEPRRP